MSLIYKELNTTSSDSWKKQRRSPWAVQDSAGVNNVDNVPLERSVFWQFRLESWRIFHSYESIVSKCLAFISQGEPRLRYEIVLRGSHCFFWRSEEARDPDGEYVSGECPGIAKIPRVSGNLGDSLTN